ncbi:MAG: SAM-dependent methyltransferase [Candidatus Binatia bacterium]
MLSFRQFVDDALFHPAWGYYSTGQVRFGEGGHYDTYPLALSPVFGRMLAAYAERAWRRCGRPGHFELCELGAGNGQLCLDVLAAVEARAAEGRAGSAFADAFCYRIVERSPGLVARQRETLGPLAPQVTWTRADLARRVLRGMPFGDCGLVFGNEVLDCFAPERVVPQVDGRPRVTFVAARLEGRALGRAALARAMTDARQRRRVRFAEVLRPLAAVRGLGAFLARHHPELFRAGGARLPYFATPQLEPFLANARKLYRRAEALWIDYGDTRAYHLTAPETKRLVAGPPKSGHTVYDDPGRDDITVMVDFSVAMTAAVRAGWRVVFYGDQGALAHRSGVALDRRAQALIVRTRTLGWMLSFMGVGPERAWRRGGLTFDTRHAKGGRLVDDVRQAMAEFLGKTPTPFRLLVLRAD